MGLFDGFKRTFSIGGARIGILTDQSYFCQGDAVTGTVGLIGHDYPLAGTAVTVELIEFWRESRGTGKNRRTVTVRRSRATKRLKGQFALGVGDTERFSFSLKLPANCRISTSSTGWSLLVRLDVPAAVDATSRQKLDIRPHRSILALQSSLNSRLGFTVKGRTTWDARKREINFKMIPPADLKKELDDVKFVLTHRLDGGISGKAGFDLQEKKLTDYFRAMLWRDIVKVNFDLGVEDIFGTNGRVKEATVAGAFSKLMRSVLSEAKRGA